MSKNTQVTLKIASTEVLLVENMSVGMSAAVAATTLYSPSPILYQMRTTHACECIFEGSLWSVMSCCCVLSLYVRLSAAANKHGASCCCCSCCCCTHNRLVNSTPPLTLAKASQTPLSVMRCVEVSSESVRLPLLLLLLTMLHDLTDQRHRSPNEAQLELQTCIGKRSSVPVQQCMLLHLMLLPSHHSQIRTHACESIFDSTECHEMLLSSESVCLPQDIILCLVDVHDQVMIALSICCLHCCTELTAEQMMIYLVVASIAVRHVHRSSGRGSNSAMLPIYCFHWMAGTCEQSQLSNNIEIKQSSRYIRANSSLIR